MHNLFRVDENSLEQCWAAHIVQCCQPYSVQHCYTWSQANSGSTILNNIVDNVEMLAAKHCSTLFSTALNRLCDFGCVVENRMEQCYWGNIIPGCQQYWAILLSLSSLHSGGTMHFLQHCILFLTWNRLQRCLRQQFCFTCFPNCNSSFDSGAT